MKSLQVLIAALVSISSTPVVAEECFRQVNDRVSVVVQPAEALDLRDNFPTVLAHNSTINFEDNGVRLTLSWRDLTRIKRQLNPYAAYLKEPIGSDFTATFGPVDVASSDVWASAQSGTARIVVLMDGSGVATSVEPRRPRPAGRINPNAYMSHSLGETRLQGNSVASEIFNGLANTEQYVFQYITNYSKDRLGQETYDAVATLEFSAAELIEASKALDEFSNIRCGAIFG